MTRRDHPRGCGEHDVRLGIYTMSEGSSPRMRGTPTVASSWGNIIGIIPADAGNTSPTTGTARLSRDHPRGCGEHSIETVLTFLSMGSSPRMRGTHILTTDIDDPLRIIPADAGNTPINHF